MRPPRIYSRANRMGTPTKGPVSNLAIMIEVVFFFITMMIYAFFSIQGQIAEKDIKLIEINPIVEDSSIVLILDGVYSLPKSYNDNFYLLDPDAVCYTVKDKKDMKLIEFHHRNTDKYITDSSLTLHPDTNDKYICFKQNGEHYNLVALKNENTQEWEKANIIQKFIFKIQNLLLY